MKKSILSAIAFSLILGSAGIVSSCKDYNEDLRYELLNELANLDMKLDNKIDQQVKELENKQKELENLIKQLTSCNCGIDKPWTSDLDTKIQEAVDMLRKECASKPSLTEDEARAIAKEIITQQLKNYYTKAEVDELLNKMKCSCDIDALKAEIVSQIQAAITSTVTKDYITKLVGDYYVVADVLKDYVKNDEFEALKAQVDAITSCGTACAELASTVADIKAEVASIKALAEANKDDIVKLYELNKHVNTEIVTLKNAVEAAQATADKAIDNAKHAQETADQALLAANKALSQISDDLKPRVEALETFRDDWKNILESWKVDIPILQDAVSNLQNNVKDLDEDVKAIKQALADSLFHAYDTADKAYALAQSNEDRIEALELNYTTLNTLVDNHYIELLDSVQRHYNDIQTLKTECEANLAAAKAYTDAQVTAATTALTTKIDDLEEAMKAADKATNDRIDALNDEYQTRFSKVESDVAALQGLAQRVKDLEDWKVGDFAQWQKAVDNDIQGLKDAIKTIYDTIAKLADKVNALETSYKKTLANLITGISVEQICNPVFGTYNMPTNRNTHVLIAFYGENEGDNVKFPNKSTKNYIFPSEVLTAEEWDMISGVAQKNIMSGATLLEESDDNAGTLYLTINPTDVDFEGQTMTLVNSQGKDAGVTLSPAKASDKTLTFGYTRAAAQNGFYEMSAKITDINNVQKVNFEIEKYGEIMKDLITYKDGFDLSRAVSTVYDQFDGFLDANALKATWTDGEGVEHGVMSHYGVAATAVKPLSYKFLADKKFNSIPGVDQIENFINRGAKELKKELKKALDDAFGKVSDGFPAMPTIKKFELDPASVDYQNMVAKFNLTTTATVDINGAQYKVGNDLIIRDSHNNAVTDAYGQPIKIAAGTIIEVNDGEMTVKITMDLRDVFGDFYKDLASNVNDLVDALQDYATKANDALLALNNISVSVDNLGDNITNSLISLIEKIEKKLVDILNGAIARLQPALFVKVDGNYRKVSGAVHYPTKINSSSVTLYPYSYTAETINPAYLKHVAVVNVMDNAMTTSAQDGDATCKQYLDAANAQTNMNKVINGRIHEIELTGLKSGYTYQIAYSAIDYSGNVVTKRSAISVK